MENNVIINTLAFMRRVQLTGEEVPAFVECTNGLNELLKKQSITKEIEKTEEEKQ